MNLLQTIIQTLVLALIQGVTELFPISSLGHTVIIPGLLHWNSLSDPAFLPIVTALHLGTSIALILYFWRDWLQVIKTLFTTAKTRKVERGTPEWGSWLIIIGCIPTGLLGLLLQKKIEALFTSPLYTAAFLVCNGSLLFLGEAMRRRSESQFKTFSPREREARFRHLNSLSIKEALLVGLAQSLALIPGFSRSGSTIVGGLMVKLTHEDAARFSFLLGTPIILAAALIEVPKLLHQHTYPFWLIILGMLISGVAAYLSTKFLEKYFEKGNLNPFAYYCWGAGLFSLIMFAFVIH